ncbi:hypothetical protein B0F90DRAFT_1875853 [Multifurca ochricompacta]|uniref:Uncharacterized protein n=1 Tax=Multifurca ochricompacta TaxID=376703 RepID=A0AAD4M290_9AGAM|nr:hypothetical protein B0F90DRAFT_1875853 [Multifurca ochricompacta]
MHDSYTEIILPFHSDPHLLDQYTNTSGGLRTGKLFEHLDSLAGSIAYKHFLGPSIEYMSCITSRISRRGQFSPGWRMMDMLAPLSPIRDLRLSGRSSVEIAVKMEALRKW